MHNLKYLCLNTSMYRSLVGYVNGSVEVEWFPVTRENYRSWMFTTHCNIRFTGGVVVLVIPRLFSENG